MRATIVAIAFSFLCVCQLRAQTASADEISKWQKNPQPLENTSCKLITSLLDKNRDNEASRDLHLSLGWWGRGFIEGAAYMIDPPGKEPKASKKVSEFGLTVDVVAAHLEAYCRSNPNDTPVEAVQDLLLKALK